MSSSTSKLQALTANIERIIRGKPEEIKFVITALMARGHILLEDNPGAGKTVLAKTLAQSIAEPTTEFSHTGGGVAFKRVQFTPDLLPMLLWCLVTASRYWQQRRARHWRVFPLLIFMVEKPAKGPWMKAYDMQ